MHSSGLNVASTMLNIGPDQPTWDILRLLAKNMTIKMLMNLGNVCFVIKELGTKGWVIYLALIGSKWKTTHSIQIISALNQVDQDEEKDLKKMHLKNQRLKKQRSGSMKIVLSGYLEFMSLDQGKINDLLKVISL